MIQKWTPTFKFLFCLLTLLYCDLASAAPWSEHQEVIQEVERETYKLEQELQVQVERKNSTRDHSRREEIVQRIVEIHAELIGQRKKIDNIRSHLKLEHPDLKVDLDQYDSRSSGVTANRSRPPSRISGQLDQLLMKVERKFASFVKQEEKKKEIIEVEKVVQKKEKRKKERDADTYLRRKSKVRLVE